MTIPLMVSGVWRLVTGSWQLAVGPWVLARSKKRAASGRSTERSKLFIFELTDEKSSP